MSSNSQIAACGAAIADKVYDPAEIAMCNQHGSNSRIVGCLAQSGRRRAPARAARPAAPSGDAVVQIVNDSDTRLTRIYLRAHGAGRWPPSTWRGVLDPGMQVRLNVPPGDWDVCVETADGHSSWWNPAHIGHQTGRLTVAGDDPEVHAVGGDLEHARGG